MEYLSSREPEHRIYSKIWFDRDEEVFGRKKGSRLIYYTNVGTIPEEGSYTVISDRGATLGELSEKFVEHLSSGDVFVLGGRPYEFERCRGMTVYAKKAEGQRPTVPSWAGEMLPRSFDLAVEVGKFRGAVLEKLNNGKDETKEWMMNEYKVDEGSAVSIINYIEAQKAVNPVLPTDKDFLVEGYKDLKGNCNIVFHFCLGRRVNDALSRAYAFAISKALKCNVRVSVTDDNFMLTSPKRIDIDKIPGLVNSSKLEGTLKRAIKNTEMFKQRFRHCATRSFMILRNYKGHEVSIGRQQLRSSRVLDYLHRLENFPVIKETYNEIENEVMDLKNAKRILQSIEKGDIKVHTSDYSSLPSPLAYNVVLLGIGDMVLMEDRSVLLRELHRQVLRRVMPEDMMRPEIEPSAIKRHFEAKFHKVRDKEDLRTLLGIVGPMNLLQRKGTNVFHFTDLEPKELDPIIDELTEENAIQSIYTPAGVHWVFTEDIGTYSAIHAQDLSMNELEKK
ncbi:MAG: ATP-dependent helicase, partial [Thermoplasmata archaeon]|nr:ATP-dependent helicase [Thermoplasmata archaeon]